MKIQKFPHLSLRVPNETHTDPTRTEVKEMLAVMHEANGSGLASVQVGQPGRFFVADLPGEVFIDPVIDSFSPETEIALEGCLSLPGVVVPVRRSTKIILNWTDSVGERTGGILMGIDARLVQHEIDHLDGVLFIDVAEDKRRALQAACAAFSEPNLIGITQYRVTCVNDFLHGWLNEYRWHWGRHVLREKHIRMEVEIMKHVGLYEPGLQVDHINGCRMDNRVENLRMVPRSYKKGGGIRKRPDRHGDNWVAEISIKKGPKGGKGTKKGRRIYLGTFREKEDAIIARQAAVVKYFGDCYDDPVPPCGLAAMGFCPDCEHPPGAPTPLYDPPERAPKKKAPAREKAAPRLGATEAEEIREMKIRITDTVNHGVPI